VKFTIVALGHKLPGWVQTGFDEYAKRMPAEARIEVALPKQALRVVLDERGEMITTKRLAEWMAGWMNDGAAPCFIIGSADGLSPAFKKTAHKTIALSGCTLPHGLVRVLLVEQLYRAWSLNNNHPYHRE
jgi:23S rRNA (pseudouridine1915-N3)-methyltransferase